MDDPFPRTSNRRSTTAKRHEDEIPAEDEVQRAVGRVVPNVVLKERDALAIPLLQAVRFVLAVVYVEGGVNTPVRAFLQRSGKGRIMRSTPPQRRLTPNVH